MQATSPLATLPSKPKMSPPFSTSARCRSMLQWPRNGKSYQGSIYRRLLVYPPTPTSFAVIVTGHTAPANPPPVRALSCSSPPAALSAAPALSLLTAGLQHNLALPLAAQRSTGMPKNVPGPSTKPLGYVDMCYRGGWREIKIRMAWYNYEGGMGALRIDTIGRGTQFVKIWADRKGTALWTLTSIPFNWAVHLISLHTITSAAVAAFHRSNSCIRRGWAVKGGCTLMELFSRQDVMPYKSFSLKEGVRFPP